MKACLPSVQLLSYHWQVLSPDPLSLSAALTCIKNLSNLCIEQLRIKWSRVEYSAAGNTNHRRGMCKFSRCNVHDRAEHWHTRHCRDLLCTWTWSPSSVVHTRSLYLRKGGQTDKPSDSQARAGSGVFPPSHTAGNVLTKLRSMPEIELERLTQPPLQMPGPTSPVPGSISRAASEHLLRRQASAVTPPLHVSCPR